MRDAETSGAPARATEEGAGAEGSARGPRETPGVAGPTTPARGPPQAVGGTAGARRCAAPLPEPSPDPVPEPGPHGRRSGSENAVPPTGAAASVSTRTRSEGGGTAPEGQARGGGPWASGPPEGGGPQVSPGEGGARGRGADGGHGGGGRAYPLARGRGRMGPVAEGRPVGRGGAVTSRSPERPERKCGCRTGPYPQPKGGQVARGEGGRTIRGGRGGSAMGRAARGPVGAGTPWELEATDGRGAGARRDGAAYGEEGAL